MLFLGSRCELVFAFFSFRDMFSHTDHSESDSSPDFFSNCGPATVSLQPQALKLREKVPVPGKLIRSVVPQSKLTQENTESNQLFYGRLKLISAFDCEGKLKKRSSCNNLGN